LTKSSGYQTNVRTNVLTEIFKNCFYYLLKFYSLFNADKIITCVLKISLPVPVKRIYGYIRISKKGA